MEFRKIDRKCPKCQKPFLKAIEITKGHVSGYNCENCGSDYDAITYHDWDNRKHYWLGRLRNPDFWSLDNETMIEGLLLMEKHEKEGMKEYLGTYIIEEIREK